MHKKQVEQQAIFILLLFYGTCSQSSFSDAFLQK
jgi:hypothetical protein